MPLTHSIIETNNAADYHDIDVYVSNGVSDWLITVTFDKQVGALLEDAKPLFAASCAHDFEEIDSVPDDVLAEFNRIRPEVVAMLMPSTAPSDVVKKTGSRSAKKDYAIEVYGPPVKTWLAMRSDEDKENDMPPLTTDIQLAEPYAVFADARKACKVAANRYPGRSFKVDVIN